jgi:hypothetical protein
MDGKGVAKNGMELCDQVRAALAGGGLHGRTELESHIEGCEVCAALAAAQPTLGHTTQSGAGASEAGIDAEAMFTALDEVIGRERGPTAFLRSRPTVVRRGSLAALLILLFVGFSLARPARALEPFELLHRRIGLVGLLVFVLAGVWLALSPTHRPLVPRPVRFGVFAAALGASLVIGLVPTQGWWTNPAAAWTVNVGLPCLIFGLAVAVPVYFLVRVFDRSPNGVSMFTGALVAGLAGNTALHLRCLLRDAQHFLIGHFGVILLALFVATVWSRGRPVLRGVGPRSR